MISDEERVTGDRHWRQAFEALVRLLSRNGLEVSIVGQADEIHVTPRRRPDVFAGLSRREPS